MPSGRQREARAELVVEIVGAHHDLDGERRFATFAAGADRRLAAMAHASAAAATTQGTIASQRCYGRPRSVAIGAAAMEDSGARGSPSASSSTSRASPIACSRWRGLLTRQRSSRLLIAGGVVAGSSDQSGSRSITVASVSATVSPANARRPGQHLVEHHAERPDVGAPVDRRRRAPAPGSCSRRCRGSCPPAVAASRERRRVRESMALDDRRRSPSSAFARPKSSTLTRRPSARAA